MKTILKPLRIALLSVFALAAAPAAHAQININVNPPSWGPAVPAGAQYYYIPETNGFYDVPARQYVVSRNGQWIRTNSLSGYNPADFHPVVVDYVGTQPWSRYDEYKAKYPKRMPPGQAKKQGYRANPSNGGLPPGQAKKQYRTRDDDRPRNGSMIPGVRLPDDRRYDDRRDDRRYDDRHDNDRRDEDRDEDGGKGKGHGNGKGHGKGKGRD